MFNIWCKVKKINIFLVVFGLIFSVGSIFIDEKYDYKSLILTILLVLYLLKDIIKYLSLKKNGKLIENIPYTLKELNNNEKLLTITYRLNNSKIVEFHKRIKSNNNIKENGTTNILIDNNNYYNYYIFDKKNN